MSEQAISYIPKNVRHQQFEHDQFNQPHVHKVTRITKDGHVYINLPEQLSLQVLARLCLGLNSRLQDNSLKVGDSVLVVYENANHNLPIIVGTIADRIMVETSIEDSFIKESEKIHFKGKQIIFESDGDITIECGKSSICIKNNGKIILKGKEIISRASATNKIKGATVKIN